MSTHLLLTKQHVADIDFDLSILEASDVENRNMIKIMRYMLRTGKSLFLDEESIAKNHEPKTSMSLPAWAGYQLGYKQALKDLL